MGDAVIEEAMMATNLMEEELIGGSYVAYADVAASFSANLCEVAEQQEALDLYGSAVGQEVYVNRSKRLICKRCGQGFKNKTLLKKHQVIHAKDNIFECEECHKLFNRKESLTRHMLVHSGIKFYECPECSRTFNQKGHVRTHMLVHTKEKSFECDQCNMKFARKDNLKRHSMLHTRKKMFECLVCSKRFNQNCHLEAHMVIHTQEKNFECQECSMKFARRDTLKRHLLVHNKEKTYECDFCSEKFIQNSHLKAHALVHTREKKFRCRECDKKFARKGSLKRHMLVHTGERNFECKECSKTFVQRSHLNKHLLIHSAAKEKMSEDRVDQFLQNIHKVEVHIEPGLDPSNVDGSCAIVKKELPTQSEQSTINHSSQMQATTKIQPPHRQPTQSKVYSKGTYPSKDQTRTAYSAGNSSSAFSSVQQGNSHLAPLHNIQHYPGHSSAQNMTPGHVAMKQQRNPQDPSNETPQGQNNILANSNSVMALALIDHFLTGNENQDNMVESSSKGNKPNSNQWGQKTHQELLAAQTLSAIGQKSTVANDNHYQVYGQGPPITSQIGTCHLQPMPQGVLASGPSVMKMRPPSNAEWMSHPQNIVYNVPPPAHEIFRYYSPTNMQLAHPANNREMEQYRDGIYRLPEGSCMPADLRASPRKSKYPQKMVVPIGEWPATSLPMPPSNINLNMPVYAHSKHMSEHPR